MTGYKNGSSVSQLQEEVEDEVEYTLIITNKVLIMAHKKGKRRLGQVNRDHAARNGGEVKKAWQLLKRKRPS